MKIKLTVFLLTVLIALSPMSVFAQGGMTTSEWQARAYAEQHGCDPSQWCHNPLLNYVPPAGLLGAIGQYGNMLGVWPDGSTVRNERPYTNKWCPPDWQNCGYYGQDHPAPLHQQYPQGQQQFTPQPNHYAQQCGWYTLQGQQQPTWLCQP